MDDCWEIVHLFYFPESECLNKRGSGKNRILRQAEDFNGKKKMVISGMKYFQEKKEDRTAFPSARLNGKKLCLFYNR